MYYQIIIEPSAYKDLENIYHFIVTNDSSSKAANFLNQLKDTIKTLEYMPTRCRKSYYDSSKNTRDLIYKGYTIVFKINNSNVHILSIFRQRSF